MLALLRHGESTWNRSGRFTGWADPPLTALGREHAVDAGRALASVAEWDAVHTSCLGRSIATAELAAPGVTPVRDLRLNERHVGELEGARHTDIERRFGAAAVASWRWGWDRPPLLAVDDPRHLRDVDRYPGRAVPLGESLADVVDRVRPWLAEVTERLRRSEHVVAVTHGTTMRALRVLIEDPADVADIRPANGGWRIYRYDSGVLRPVLQQ